jgi:hypothetical protein
MRLHSRKNQAEVLCQVNPRKPLIHLRKHDPLALASVRPATGSLLIADGSILKTPTSFSASSTAIDASMYDSRPSKHALRFGRSSAWWPRRHRAGKLDPKIRSVVRQAHHWITCLRTRAMTATRPVALSANTSSMEMLRRYSLLHRSIHFLSIALLYLNYIAVARF